MKLEFELTHSLKAKWHFNAHRNQLSHTTYTSNWHEQIELLFVEDGEGYVIINFIPYPAKKGDIFIINSNHIHCISNENAPTDSLTVYSVIVPNDIFTQTGYNPQSLMFEYKVSDSNAVKLFELFVSERESNNTFHIQYSYSALNMLSIYLLRNYSIEFTKNETTVSKIQQAFHYIKNHLSENITGSIVAREIGFSNGHFLRTLKNLTGFTFSDILNRFRCAQACVLLADSNLSVYEISIQCGYNNFPYFSRTFKELNGTSPLQYRKQITNLSTENNPIS